MASPGTDLIVDLTERVLTLTLHRPSKLNALSSDMIGSMIDQLQRAVTDPAIGAVVVTGSGRGFCAGGDVSAMSANSAELSFESRVDRQNSVHELSKLLWEMPKVTIAAVNGPAVGAGLGIALSCDLCFASERARFGTAFAKVGLGGDFGTSWQLARKVGAAKAKELFFLGELQSAEQAAALGLVNRVLPESNFIGEVMDIARRIAHGPLVSYRYMKQNVNMALSSDFPTSLQREAVSHLRCSQTQDHREGVAAFLEKRAPRFSGR
ncbi:MAG TPA: enoyl-CoA hydratase [Polyangiales bacterium]|nr:enoyl-CoA hydratase [Polyangiales bacterium]